MERIPILPLLMDEHVEELKDYFKYQKGVIYSKQDIVMIYNLIRDWTAEPQSPPRG